MNDTTYEYEFRSGGYEVTLSDGTVELRWNRLGETVKLERRYSERATEIFETMSNLLDNGIESPKVLFKAFATV